MSYLAGKANSFGRDLSRICPPKIAFLIGIGLIALFKLWLVHKEEIYGSANLYDQLCYLRAAEKWYWGAEYSWLSFVRPPAFPLWIAFVHATGLPLRLAQELLFLGAYVVFIAALRVAGVPRLLALLIYAAAILHPASYQLYNQVVTDTMYAAVLPLALAGLIFVFVRSRWRDAIWTGAAFGILWNVREESVMIVVILGTFVALYFSGRLLLTGSWKTAVSVIWKPTLVILGVLGLFVLAVDGANYRVAQVFSKSESSAPGVKAAYKALLRIRPDKFIRFVPVSKATRARAYEVSPTFSQLKPELEGGTGQDWEYQARATLGIQNEIAAGWFFWALRDAANKIGVHRNARDANFFYWKVAEEINRACDEKRLPQRTVLFSLVDPGSWSALKYSRQAVGRICRLFVSRYPRSSQHEDVVLRRGERQLYDEMTLRRTAYARVGVWQIAGWALRSGDPVKFVGVSDAGGEIEAASTHFSPRPDVVRHFSDDPLVPLNSQFVLSADVFRTDSSDRKLVFVTESGATFTGSVAEILQGKAPASTAAGPPLLCVIDSQKISAPPKSLAVSLEEFAGAYYRLFVRALIYVGILGALVLIVSYQMVDIKDPIYGVLLLLAVTTISRMALFVFLDATAFPANELRYLFPVMPLLNSILILLIGQSVRTGHRMATAKLLPGP